METVTKLRSFKFLGSAVFDTVFSYIAAIAIAKALNLDMALMIASVFPMSLVFHILFKVESPLTVRFFKTPWLQILFWINMIYVVYSTFIKL